MLNVRCSILLPLSTFRRVAVYHLQLSVPQASRLQSSEKFDLTDYCLLTVKRICPIHAEPVQYTLTQSCHCPYPSMFVRVRPYLSIPLIPSFDNTNSGNRAHFRNPSRAFFLISPRLYVVGFFCRVALWPTFITNCPTRLSYFCVQYFFDSMFDVEC